MKKAFFAFYWGPENYLAADLAVRLIWEQHTFQGATQGLMQQLLSETGQLLAQCPNKTRYLALETPNEKNAYQTILVCDFRLEPSQQFAKELIDKFDKLDVYPCRVEQV